MSLLHVFISRWLLVLNFLVYTMFSSLEFFCTSRFRQGGSSFSASQTPNLGVSGYSFPSALCFHVFLSAAGGWGNFIPSSPPHAHSFLATLPLVLDFLAPSPGLCSSVFFSFLFIPSFSADAPTSGPACSSLTFS